MPYYNHPHPELPPVDDETRLIRVMPRTRVQQMQNESILYLPRPWQFDDDFEGRLYTSERTTILESELRAGQAFVANVITDMSDRLTSQLAVSCWREYVEGDPILWDAYSDGAVDKQAIFSSVGRLKQAIPPSYQFTIARVNYVERDNYVFQGNFPDLRIFQKDRKDWEWEREIRLVINQMKGGIIPFSPKETSGLSVTAPFDKLVEQVLDRPDS